MRFKIVCCGWMCEEFVERTLQSIDQQLFRNFDVCLIDDCSTDRTGQLIRDWCHDRLAEKPPDAFCGGPSTWRYYWNTERFGTVHNQFDAIFNMLQPADDDVVIWLDLDGDQFAHPHVLDELTEAYADGTLLTYGSYQPIPDPGTTTPATPFPEEVVQTNTYRQEMLRNGCHFNHLRTMKGEVVNAIPAKQFFWQDDRGWYEHGADYIFMAAGLELAGGRYKCLDEVLCLYNHANPLADYLAHPEQTSACVVDYLSRPPLEPLHAVDC